MDFGKKPKHENPRKGANPISQLFFLWITPLLWKGMKNGLTTDDLSKCLRKDKSDVLGDDLEREWNRERVAAMKGKRKPRLWRPICRLFVVPCLIDGLSQGIFVLIRCFMPLVFSQFLIQFQRPFVPENMNIFNTSSRMQVNESLITSGSQQNELSQKMYSLVYYVWNDVYCLAFLLISMTFSVTFFAHHARIRLILLGARLKIACCSLLYRKSLRLSASAANRTGQGYLVNLATNDVARFDLLLCYVNFIWILPPQSVLICYLLWQRVRWAAVIGVIGLLLKTVPVQTRLGHYALLLRKKIAERSDRRIGIMNEIIQGIQVIKMYAWEIPFHKLVSEARRLEIKQIQYSSYIKIFTLSSHIFVARSTLFISIATCILTGESITADIVFSMAQYLQILRLVAASLYPFGVSLGAEALMSLRRIEAFLLEDEKNEGETNVKRRSSVIAINENENAIEINNLSASWDPNSNNSTLNQIDLKIKSRKVCAIVGPVGGGKSSLIQLLLGELPVQLGNVIVNGSVSYAAQEPWIFSGTVRHNILFGQTYDKIRYNKVAKSCALLTDFEQWPNGDKTLVGERGASLSGGQRARISLARAMYKPAAIYLLDDPLSAVDAHVGKHLFEHVIGPNAQIAKNATRILVTHQIHFLKEADLIVIMDGGKITHRDTFAEHSNSDVDFTKLSQKVEQEEDENNDRNPEEVYSDDGQVYIDNENIPYIDDVSIGIPYKALRRASKISSKFSSRSSIESRDIGTDQVKREEQIQRGVPWTAFAYYFLAGSSRCGILFMALVMVLTQIIVSGTDFFLKFWTQEEFKRKNKESVPFTPSEYLCMYGSFTVCVIFISTTRSTIFLSLCMRASKVLHDKMFNSILHAPMRFFETNQSGRILNRFSKDIGCIDETLPTCLLESVQTMSDMLGILIIVICLDRVMILVFLCCVLLCSLVLKLYLRASQDLKRLEGTCRSPLLSHLTASFDGLSTIRSRNVQTELCHEFDELQDVHSSVWQLTMTSTQAFAFWVDSLCCTFAACVTFSFVALYENTFSGNVGLAISQSLDLTGMVQFGMRQVTESMQQMTNVERIVQYIDLDPEHSPAQKAPAKWPKTGKIDVKDLYLRYDLNGAPTLKCIQFEIRAGFKVGVIGRTGAGKSSLITALFRLAHVEGTIKIDNVDTGTMSLESLRSKISIIPQNPVLFSGTLRKNLDPFEEYSDDDIWKSLESIQLKESVSFSEGLNMPVLVHGSNFSVGQRQLLCLARAILRNNRILVLDEATANVDPQTDDLIQKTIRRQFADCTVLTVAHRLHTIIDSDRVLVMDAGRIAEYDHPFKLLHGDDGVFYGMVRALGSNEFTRLRNLAKKKYE